ncbi:Retrovirus-related Pol polyprotein from transposon 412 [Araneus ventricosus]|uniref:RNA-directed DNA polymerase n=1 Tax=Araneus ventricosus TaxID=182803 RepID=A0A4Y2QLD7_ARAVE|nr:Retrovirus-related Pol polyprotein from transposon 412 [Araneus ventricosus]
MGKVNGIEMPIFRDTGATLDLICKKYVPFSMCTNETVWIRTPLEESAVCLPIAEVVLDCDFGRIITKAAVLRDSLDQGRYIFGNKTAALFEEAKNNKEIQVYEFVEEQKKSAELKQLFEEAKNESSKKTNYIVEDDLLFSKKEVKNGTKCKLLVVPEKYRENLMTIGHEGAAAHLGVTKTKDALFKTFYWPNCFSDIENFVKTYDKCQKVGKPQDKKKTSLKIVHVITEIFTKINIDASGPLPKAPSGNRHIIIALCMSSKYPDAFPVANLCSTTIMNALLQIFSRMGFPRELQTDQGTSFMSALTTEFLEKFGVKVVRSSVYHPQSNPVERMHSTLKRILRVLRLEALPDWEKILPQSLFALRTVIHDSTGFSPAELVHGKKPRTPMMLLYEKLTEEDPVENSVVEYVFELINRMKKCQELTVKNMEDAKQKQELWYDRKTVKRQFRPGELVLVMAPPRPTKLSVQWIVLEK